MSDVLDPQLTLEFESMNASLAEDAIIAELESDNLILRLYQPGGVPQPGDPWFSGGQGGGGLTQAQLDLLTRGITDSAIAAAQAAANVTAASAAQAVLDAEVRARQLADSILTATISEESATRQTATDSIAVDIITVGARIDENVAAIQSEQVARADANSATALRIDQVVAVNSSNTVAISSEELARTEGDSALGARIDVVVAANSQNAASIVTEQNARITADSALSTRVDAVSANVGSNTATITTLQQSQATNYAALASSINTLTVTLNGHSTSIQTQQTVTDGLSAQYAIKIDNNGWISGYGLTSTPVNGIPVSEFAVRSDKFSIWLPGYAGIAPFQVQMVNGVPQVSMVNAMIADASITNLQVQDGAITNAKIGNLEVNTIKLAGNSVTVPGFISGYGGVPQVQSGTLVGPVGSITMYFPDNARIVGITSWQAAAWLDTNARVQLRVDGNAFLDVSNSAKDKFTSSFTAAGSAYVGPGNHTFEIFVGDDWSGGAWDLGNWSLLVLGVMR
jgi:hypothetical protein